MLKFAHNFDASKLKLLIFDLDGTLVDSRVDLIQSVNAMLQHFHRPELPGDVIASYVGDGAPMLVRRALGDPDDERFVQEETGVPAAQADLGKAYLRVGEIQNKLGAFAKSEDAYRRAESIFGQLQGSNDLVNQRIVDELGLGEFFVRVYGGNSFQTKKPDPLGVNTLLEETGVRSDEAIIIGDSSVDVITGRNADLWTCGVTYGFAPRTLDDAPPDVLVDTPSDLVQLFT